LSKRYNAVPLSIQDMTNSKTIYGLLILSLALALVTGLRRIVQSNPAAGALLATTSASALGFAQPQPTLAAAVAVTTTTAVTTNPNLQAQALGNSAVPAQLTPRAGGAFVQLVAHDADSLNPLVTTNATSRAIFQKIYPVLIDQDPVSGLPTVGRGLAQRWQFADDGRTITFTLRSDIRWSDGAPVTAQDVKFTYDAILDPTVSTLYRDNFANVNEIVIAEGDRQTLVLRLANADCALLQALHQPILPSHLYTGFTAEQLANPDLLPQVSAGPFLFIDWIAGHRITLVRNVAYWEGAPRLDRWEFQIVPDPLTQLQLLMDGNADWLELTAAQIAQVQDRPALALYETLGDSLTFVALNLANPQQPQAGRNADGTLNAQEPHPLLGDRRLRQALVNAIDHNSLLNEVYGTGAQALSSYVLPTSSWAYAADTPTPAYDPTAAQRLLAELGWRDSDGDGVRDRNGTLLRLSLLTNGDSEQRVQLGLLLAARWQAVGIDVRFEQRAFDAVADSLLGQQYDMVLIGWDNLGADPANSDFWHSSYDAPGDGANFVSYQNAEVDNWLDAARTLPTCDPALRSKLYQAVQQQIAQDLPYILLSGPVKRWAYPVAWHELQPAPWRFDYNAHRWWR